MQVRSKARRWDVCRATECEIDACGHNDLLGPSYISSPNVKSSKGQCVTKLNVWMCANMCRIDTGPNQDDVCVASGMFLSEKKKRNAPCSTGHSKIHGIFCFSNHLMI